MNITNYNNMYKKMKFTNKILILILIVLSKSTLSSQNLKCSQEKKNIISIAKAKLLEVGGKSFLRDDYVFNVTKKNNLWHVTGRHNGKPIIINGKKGYYAGRSGYVIIDSQTCEILECGPGISPKNKVTKISKEKHEEIQKN